VEARGGHDHYDWTSSEEGMNKIEGTIIKAWNLVDAGGALPGVSIKTSHEKLRQWDGPLCGRQVVVEAKDDHDACVLEIEQLCKEIGKLRTDLAAREAEVERLRDANLQRVAEGMSAWCSPPDEQAVYTVHAYRWGDRERHSYTVGVYSKKHAAMKAADIEEDYRGGKYRCEVLGWQLDSGREGNHDIAPKTVKPLPTESTFRQRKSVEE